MPPSVEQLVLPPAIRADFERIAASSEAVDRLEASARRLVARVPLRARVLEIGCGTGELARELARKRGAKVTAIDLSARMIEVARVRTPALLGIEYGVADFMALAPHGFDIVISANTLHQLPLAAAAAHMADALVPGGTVLIADRFAARGLLELPYNAASWLAGAPRPGAAAEAPPGTDELAALGAIRRELRAVLPGVTLRRHISWRYTAVWTRP